MNDKKERVYSEEDLCEYTILQKIDELEKQLKNIKNEFNGMYETKEAANAIHVKLRQSDAKINNSINTLKEITPTDVGVKDNKLGLEHGSTWLTNQNAINLGDGLIYDEATKTLKASGGGGASSTIRIEYIADSFKWAPPSSDKTYNVGDYELSDYKTLDENELPLQLQNTSVKKIGTATFILMPVELKFNTNMVQAIVLVCINPGTIPANTRISTYVFRVKLVSE